MHFRRFRLVLGNMKFFYSFLDCFVFCCYAVFSSSPTSISSWQFIAGNRVYLYSLFNIDLLFDVVSCNFLKILHRRKEAQGRSTSEDPVVGAMMGLRYILR